MILLNLTLGSRYHFHPESPLLLMIVCCTWRPWRYSTLITRELVFIAFAIHLPPQTLMDNYLHLLFLHSTPLILLLQDTPKYSLLFQESLCLLPCSSLSPEYTYKLILTHIEDLFLPSYSCVHKSLQNAIQSSENPQQPMALEILACFHYGQSHKSSNHIGILCHYHIDSINSINYECSQSSTRS